MGNPKFYETIRKFESFDDFLQVSALITKKYDSALKKDIKTLVQWCIPLKI